MARAFDLYRRTGASRSAVLLLAANAVPLVGVLFFGWSLWTILVLYWIENGIVGFWNMPEDHPGPGVDRARRCRSCRRRRRSRRHGNPVAGDGTPRRPGSRHATPARASCAGDPSGAARRLRGLGAARRRWADRPRGLLLRSLRHVLARARGLHLRVAVVRWAARGHVRWRSGSDPQGSARIRVTLRARQCRLSVRAERRSATDQLVVDLDRRRGAVPQPRRVVPVQLRRARRVPDRVTWRPDGGALRPRGDPPRDDHLRRVRRRLPRRTDRRARSILVALKTAFDLGLHLRERRTAGARPRSRPSSAGAPDI